LKRRSASFRFFKEALGDLCGTGTNQYQAFLASARSYDRQEFTRASFESFARQKPWIKESNGVQEFRIQPFQMRNPSLTERLQRIALPFAYVAIEIGVLLIFGLVSFARYDVR